MKIKSVIFVRRLRQIPAGDRVISSRSQVTEQLPTARSQTDLPPILHGQATKEVEERVRQFVFSVAAIYETWLRRRTSIHTRRAYHQDVMHFVRGYLKLDWPTEAAKFLRVSVQTVQAYRDWLGA